MSRTIDLTVTLKLDLANQRTRTEFYDSLEDLLRTGLGEQLSLSRDCVSVIAADDPAGIISQPACLSAIFTPTREIAIVWTVHDVLDVRPDLSLLQATELLQHVLHQHEANHGIGWDDFEHFASRLFGEPVEVAS